MSLIVSQSISDTEELVLKNDLVSIEEWIQGAIEGKIDNCYTRMKNEWVPILMDDSSVAAISASRDDFVQQVTNHSSYQDRAAHESGSINGGG